MPAAKVASISLLGSTSLLQLHSQQKAAQPAAGHDSYIGGMFPSTVHNTCSLLMISHPAQGREMMGKHALMILGHGNYQQTISASGVRYSTVALSEHQYCRVDCDPLASFPCCQYAGN